MAYSTPLFSQMNIEGVDINNAFTFYTTGGDTSLQAYPLAPLTLGTVVDGTLNGEWVLCTAATGTITKYDVVTISNAFTATQVPTTASYGLFAGIAMATATTGQALWVMTNGVSPGVNVVTGVGTGIMLFTSATAGRLAITSGGFTRIQGITLTTSSTGATAGPAVGAIVIGAQIATSQ